MKYCCSIQRQGKHGVLVSANRLPVSLQPQEESAGQHSLQDQEQEGTVRLEVPHSGSFPRGLQVPLR